MSVFLSKITHAVFAVGVLAFAAVSGPAMAAPVTLDGLMSPAEESGVYTSTADVLWYNDHQNTQFGLTSPSYLSGLQTMTARYGTGTLLGDAAAVPYFFVYMAVSLAAKNNVWGTGASDADIALYQQQFSHHANDKLTNDPTKHDTVDISDGKKWKYFDFDKATHSEKIEFDGVTGQLNTTTDYVDFKGNNKTAETSSGAGLIATRSSVDYLLLNSLCTTDACGMSLMALSMEFQFDMSERDRLIAFFSADGAMVKTHLSPELGGDLTPVPLPAAFPLFGTGLGILGFLGWRRRRKVQA